MVIADLDIDFRPSVAVVADQMGNVHVVWNYEDSTGSAIFYSRHDDTGWTKPIDVLVSPDRALPQNLRLAIDSNGMLQLIWTGSRGYHASAPALEADSVHAWKQPRPFSSEQVISADIAVAPDRTLHILYSKTGENAYHVRSDDGGATWSDPQAVSDAVLAQTAANWPRIAVGSNNQIYAAWTEVALPDGWPPLGVYFAVSVDGGLTWSDPALIDEVGYDQIAVTAGPEGDVYLAWNGMAGTADLPSVGGRYFQWSADSGDTWSPKMTITSAGFTSGNPEMGLDSSGALHLVSSFAGVDHAARKGGGWTPWVDVTAPVKGSVGNTENPVLALGSGNVVHVVFPDSRGRVWYTSSTTDAPPLGPTPFATQPAPAATPTPARLDAADPMPTPTRPALIPDSPPATQGYSNQMTPVFLGLAPVMLLLGTVLFVLMQRIRR